MKRSPKDTRRPAEGLGFPPPVVDLGLAVCTPAGRPGGVKSLPLTFWFGRCPTCRCTRLHRDGGWAEVALLGWTVGVAWR